MQHGQPASALATVVRVEMSVQNAAPFMLFVCKGTCCSNISNNNRSVQACLLIVCYGGWQWFDQAAAKAAAGGAVGGEEGGGGGHLIIIIVQSPLEQDLHTRPQLMDQGAKLGQAADCCRPDCGVLQDDTVVDVADVLGGFLGAGALHAQQVQHLRGQICELTVLQEAHSNSLPHAACLTDSMQILQMAEKCQSQTACPNGFTFVSWQPATCEHES